MLFRSRRTRQLLANALTDLMMEKRFEDITVQDILDRADVGRSTFYTHYSDKEDLLIGEIERVIHELDRLTAEAGPGQQGLLPSLALFRHIQEQRRLLGHFMWGRGAEMLTRSLQGQVSAMIEQKLRNLTRNEAEIAVPLPVVATFVASTYLMLLRWWFDEDMRHSPEEVDAMFQKLVMPAIHELIQ